MDFIKLSSRGGRIVYASVERINAIATRKNGGSLIITPDSLYEGYEVNESPEEILALINAKVIND